ncbi:MAG: hypothetical protein HYX43_08075 [Burkholderiales bacterium]|nr:hypothetical protein [Burkholderiales bacterium]
MTALVLVGGVIVGVAVGRQTSQHLEHLRTVDLPAKAAVVSAKEGVERMKRELQAAVVEANDAKLKDADATASAVIEAIGALTRLEPGDASDALSAAFSAYRGAARAAAKALMAQGDAASLVQTMQQTSAALDKLFAERSAAADAEVTAGYTSVSGGVELGIWVQVGAGLAVLIALTTAAAVITRSVLQHDLGDEPVMLCERARQCGLVAAH